MEQFSTISPALAQLFANRVSVVINRSVVLLNLLRVVPATGKNLAWDVRLGDPDNTATAYVTEGSDISDFTADLKKPATLNFAEVSKGIKITDYAVAAAKASGNPAQLANLIMDEVEAAGAQLAKTINKELYVGTGATGRIHGLLASGAPAIGPTGSYAGINPGTSGLEDWAGTEVAAGGAPVSFELLRRLRKEVYEASGKKFDLFVCDATQYAAIGALFGETRRQVDMVRTASGIIKLAGGFNALEFDGIAIVEDVDCPAGYVLGLNTMSIEIEQMTVDAHPMMTDTSRFQLAGTAEEQLGQRTTGLVTRVKQLAVGGSYTKLGLFSMLQLKVSERFAHGYLSGLDLNP